MPLFIIVIGTVLIIASIRGKEKDLAALIKGDFTGPNSFIPWIGALFIIYLLGKFGPMEEVANMMMWLVLIVIMLTSGRGFFDQLTNQFKELSQ